MTNVSLAVLLLCVITGIDLARLVVYHEVRLTVLSFGHEYIGVLHQIFLLPVLLVFFTLCKLIVGSKITREELTVVQDFGVQLASYNITGNLVSEKFVDISRVRDFVINEVSFHSFCVRPKLILFCHLF